MDCSSCQKPNRTIATYCKHCGTEIIPQGHGNGQENVIEPDFNLLVGLEELKQTLQREITAFKNMKKAGFRYDTRNLYTILIGNTGTGKNQIVQILSRIYFKNGITTHPDFRTVSAVDFPDFAKNLSANIQSAKGRILFIDNVHQLVPAGYQPGQTTSMDRLYAELDKWHGDPIVILATKEVGFREYLLANQDVNNRFNLKFYLSDMAIDELHELATKIIVEKKFQLTDDVSVKLRKRLLYLFRNQQESEKSLKTGKNGFLVHKEVNNIISEHFVNPDFQNFPSTLQPEDIKGELYELKPAAEVLKELEDFIGLEGIKEYIKKMVDLTSIQQKDSQVTGKEQITSSHMVITGNPGTGKTTLARKLGEVFAAAGVLSSGHVIDVDRSKLVGQYLGETPLLVQKYCNEAAGGILFIDEAYTLKQDDQDKFGQEAIDTLIKRMEDDRGKFIMIAAGYQSEMQRFVNANPGMKSRVKDNFFHLPDYSPAQLFSILKIFIKQGGFTLSEEAEVKAIRTLQEMHTNRSRDFGNGRDVRNLYETIRSNRAARLTATQLYDTVITATDIPGEETDLSAGRVDEVLKELNNLTGLKNVKDEVSRLIHFLEGEKIRSEAGGKKTSLNLHLVFTGNPGTGKTTVARLLATIFKHLNILPKGHLVEATDKELVEGYVGQTSQKTNKKIDEALGGVLFIDEAYSLALKSNTYGHEVITTLLKRMEDDRGKFVVIAAGYQKEMEDFFDTNSGLESRFTNKILFEDYDSDELY